MFARKLYPKAEISFMTNGVLIPVQKDEFWKICSDYNINVRISKYPIRLNNQKIEEIRKTWRVDFDWVGGKDIPVKKMWKYPIDLKSS